MAERKNTRRGRPRRDPVLMMDRPRLAADGGPIDSPVPTDHQLFVSQHTRRRWEELKAQNPAADEYDLYAEANDEAGRELTTRLRSGKKLLAYERGKGRPLGTRASGADDATQLREYAIVRRQLRGNGPQYSAVARTLQARKYKHVALGTLSQQLRRAHKKVIQK